MSSKPLINKLLLMSLFRSYSARSLLFFVFINIFLLTSSTIFFQNDSHNEFLDGSFKMLSNKSLCQMYSKKCIIKLVINNPRLVDNLKVVSTSKKILSLKSIEWCGSRNLSSKIKKYCTFDIEDEQKSTNNFIRLEENVYNLSSLYLIYVKCRLVGIKNLEFSFDFNSKNSTLPISSFSNQKLVHTGK